MHHSNTRGGDENTGFAVVESRLVLHSSRPFQERRAIARTLAYTRA